MCAQNQSGLASEIPQKTANNDLMVVYHCQTMKNALAAAINLATLLIGLILGVLLAPHLEKPAQAFSAEPQNQSVPTAPAPTSGPEQIQPGVTTGSFGAYLVLAHHIQSDELVVNGIDIMKLQQGEINLLSRSLGITQQDIQNVINDARNTHLYQVATPKPATPASQTPPTK
jgi:hypothetical protein